MSKYEATLIALIFSHLFLLILTVLSWWGNAKLQRGIVDLNLELARKLLIKVGEQTSPYPTT
jgi:hypothetical protein